MATTEAPARPNGIQDVVPPGNALRVALSFEPIKAFIFMMASFMVGLILFVFLVTMFSVGISLTVSVIMAIVGLPILALTFVAIPFVGHFERARMRLFTGIEIGDPYREKEASDKLSDRIIAFLSQGALWRDLFYSGLLFPIGLAQFVIAVVGVSVGVAFLTSPLTVAVGGNVQLWNGYQIETPAAATPLAVAGMLLLMATGYVLVLLMRSHAVFARWLIGPSEREELEKRVETLSDTRSRMVGVSLEDRRHIERDIHDSTQPKLVSLAINLGMAKEKFDSDPARARELVDEAHREARDVLAEIRNLVRGLHPSILTDRGLDAAIRSLAGYSAVPVTVDVDLNERPPAAVETTAYYIVAEALGNVTKHCQASEAHVIVRKVDSTLQVEVTDDGVGEAAITPAGGLSGLQDRAAALDGSLEIDSPEGGPTRVRATLPCES